MPRLASLVIAVPFSLFVLRRILQGKNELEPVPYLEGTSVLDHEEREWSGTFGQSIVRTDEHARTYQLFILEHWCSGVCKDNAVMVLKKKYMCSDIHILPLLNYVEARCDGSSQLTPHQTGELALKDIRGIKAHIDNMEMPSMSIGETVSKKTTTSEDRHNSKAPALNSPSRFVQFINGTLPWGLDRIDQEEGRDGTFDLSCFPKLGKGVTVYVLDSGCRQTHEDIKSRTTVVPVGRYHTANDDNGHGTHIAAIAAGSQYGVCKECSIVCVKTLDEENRGTVVDVINAVEYVLEQKEKYPTQPAVAVLSLGGEMSTDILDKAVDSLALAKIFPAVAAGNGYIDSCAWSPARADLAVTVGALRRNDKMRSSSNGGDCVSLVAPGENIRSASHFDDSLYVKMSGTSMAAPHVAGVAALILGENPALNPEQVFENMRLGSKLVLDKPYDVTYPILRILHSKCYLYEFSKKMAEENRVVPSTGFAKGGTSSSASHSAILTPIETHSPSTKATPSAQPSALPSITSQPTSSPTRPGSSPGSTQSASSPTASGLLSIPSQVTSSPSPDMVSQNVVEPSPSEAVSLPAIPTASPFTSPAKRAESWSTVSPSTTILRFRAVTVQ